MGKLESALEKAMEIRNDGQVAESPKAEAQASTTFDAPPTIDPTEIDESAISEYLITMKNPLSHISEEYRKLCTRIFSVTEKKDQNMLLVTSSAMGEGKSLTSVNLATVIASKIDHTVLLVDCDLRNPTMHKYFGLNPEVGLVDYLKGNIELEDALINTGIGRMTLLPAGIPPDNPVELLSSNKMQQLIRDIKDRYKNRYIIIDSTPVLSTAESIAIASQVDGVIFVVRERMVPKKEVTHALSLLKGANLLGVVLNADEDKSDSYYKRSYYSYSNRK